MRGRALGDGPLWELPAAGGWPGLEAAVLLLPGLGGDVGDFSLWPRHLAPELRPLTARYPGRGTGTGAEPAAGPGPDLVAFAAELADSVLLHTAEPLLILGHSLGALLGYEVAWHLQQRRRPALALHVCAAFSPSEYASFDLNSGAMTDGSLVALTESLAIPLPGGTDTPERGAVLRAVRADLALIDAYTYGPRPRPLAYPITVWSARDDAIIPVASARRWQPMTHHTLTHHTLPVPHHCVSSPRAIGPITGALRDSL
ncbi:thioesterase domain-containing protein [Streptomyces sp. KLMMK]|uniref:thioesterase II family protein n=1 Tax=Streptomyces sp. KLMMK TaxID=3109353 RepID=UPI002FFED840